MNVIKHADILKKSALATLILILAGCATKPKTTYNWDSYQDSVYQYYQGGKVGPEQQIAALNQSIEKARATNKKVPPGLYAQLGLLYANTGHTDQAFQAFNTEKTLFPESTAYMDFLLSKNKGSIK